MLMNRRIMTRVSALVIVGVALITAGCGGISPRTSLAGNPTSTKASVGKAPLEIKSEEVLPYTTKLTYGEICFNSKRYGRQFCFPCYNNEQGGCDAAVEDLVDKALACSTPIGPNNTFNRAPAYNFPTAPLAVQPNYGVNQFSAPLSVPNTYPNFSR